MSSQTSLKAQELVMCFKGYFIVLNKLLKISAKFEDLFLWLAMNIEAYRIEFEARKVFS